MKIFRNKKKGQGVVEYAGALVVASVIIAAVLQFGPDNIATMFTTIVGDIQDYLTGQVPT